MGGLQSLYDRVNQLVSDYAAQFKDVFSQRVPIFGHLVYCDFDDHYRAASDVLIYMVWATMPFWLGGLVLLLTVSGEERGWVQYWYFVVKTFEEGELLILSTSLLAPAFTVALAERLGEDSRPFPGKLSHATIVAIVMVICAALYSVQRGNAVVDGDLLFKLSVIATIVSLCLFYVASVYNHNLGPNAPDKIRADEGNFSEKYKRHRRDS